MTFEEKRNPAPFFGLICVLSVISSKLALGFPVTVAWNQFPYNSARIGGKEGVWIFPPVEVILP